MDILERPRLRGVFHQYAFFAALVAGGVLVVVADTARARLAMLVYAVALAAMFGASALYHRVKWRSLRVRAWMRRLDHSAIPLLIAGTYTPFALLAFDGTVAKAILIIVWCGAAAGLAAQPRVGRRSDLGHGDRVSRARLGRRRRHPGAVRVRDRAGDARADGRRALHGGSGHLRRARRPNPRPAVFGYHEIFHLFVIFAAVTHYVAIAAFVLPKA